MNLRPYQEASRDAVFASWRDNRSVLLVLPTGTGKTIVFSAIAKQIADAGGSTLILAHRDELIRQACDKLQAATGLMASVEKADERARGSMWPVVVASVQTLMRPARLKQWSPDHFRAVVVDEAHHALSTSYRGILDHFAGAKVLGVTATPDRGDKRSLGTVFEDIAFEYSLTQAVSDGWLARPVVQTVPINVDLDSVSITAGDYNAGDLGEALAPYLERIADSIADKARDRKTLVFLPLVKTSKAFLALLEARGIDCRHVDGMSEDRTEVGAWLKTPGPKVCCNAMLYTEGFDEPSLDCVVVLRATKSRALYAQMVGRGTRLHPGKRDLLILDYLWHTTRHDLCRPASLVAAKEEQAREATEIQEKASGSGTQLDLLDMAALASSEVARKRHEALAKALKEQARKEARRIDPLAFALSIDAADLEDYEPTMPWEEKKASVAQLTAIGKFGLDPGAVTCKGMASMILNKLIGRSRAGLATPGQLALLGKFGYERTGGLTRTEASQLIDQIKARGWTRESVSFA